MTESYEDVIKKLTFSQKMIVGVIVWAIKNHKLLWLITKVAEYLGAHLHIDKETKTWKIESDPMFNPHNQNINYDDIAAIFKSKPETFKVHEERTAEGKFKSFTVSTQ